MTEQAPPKIEFPCRYPIKVLGRSDDRLRARVVEIVERHAPGFDAAEIRLKTSSAKKFVSITVFIEATGPEQLSALHEDLMATGLVSMVM